LSGRIKVIACLDLPNMIHSEDLRTPYSIEEIQKLLGAGNDDAQVIVWGPNDDVTTAIETIEERCRMAFEGVPNETRKSLPDGTTIFERVLPGPDRMYPDTDSSPIPIKDEHIEKLKNNLPIEISERYRQLKEWRIPEDTYHYLLKNNLPPLIDKCVKECGIDARFVGTLLGHTFKHIEGHYPQTPGFSYNKIYGLLRFLKDNKLHYEVAGTMLPLIYEHPNMEFESVLTTIKFKRRNEEEILEGLPVLRNKFKQINKSKDPLAARRWIMGQLAKLAIGNLPLSKLKEKVAGGLENG
jgi:glutamyl-tRNA(Gln) amidotransferase subunit E